MFCGGGLFLCAVCGALEGALLPTCPGRRLTDAEHDANYAHYCAGTGPFAQGEGTGTLPLADEGGIVRTGAERIAERMADSRAAGILTPVPPHADIFDEIARNVFVTRGMVPDDDWVIAIAGEFRKAMADLHVEVRPAARPKVDATDTGLALMMLAGVENGDLPLSAEVPVRGDEHGVRMRGGPWVVRAGKGELHFSMIACPDGPRMYFEIVELTALVLPNRQRIKCAGPRGWVARYTPPQRVYDALQEGMRQSQLDGEVR